MEDLVVRLFGDIYRGRRVLVTGHTGFKGSWLALWLDQLGAQVSGIALDPNTAHDHWNVLGLRAADHRQDIRDARRVQALVAATRPEIVFHLAAQPLVRRSYREPIENWMTNVMGTAHVLEACRQVGGVSAIVAITSDKVYANQEWLWGYREQDRLGGHDPYSASKAACEILLDSYRKAYFADEGAPRLASARAGNVIGGGDWSEDRLIPDLVRAVESRSTLVIRSPAATRPWQHVLECVAGYLALGQKLIENGREYAEAWNFGPSPEDHRTVLEVLERLRVRWPGLAWKQTEQAQPKEATLLYLDHAKARARLHWRPVWQLEQALDATADWYRRYHEEKAVQSRAQLERYIKDARSAGAAWVDS